MWKVQGKTTFASITGRWHHKTQDDAMEISKLLELQERLLAGLIWHPDNIPTVQEIIGAKKVFRHDFQKIYDQIIELWQASKHVDVTTLSATLPKGLELRPWEWANIASGTGLQTYAALLVEAHLKRKMSELAGEVVQRAGRDEVDAFELLEHFEGSLFKLGASVSRKNFVDSASVMEEALARIRTTVETGVIGVTTGFRTLDDVLGGYQDQELIIIAGRPSVGKTALALTSARKIVKLGIPVAFFSAEMGRTQLAIRLLAQETGLNGHRINVGLLNKDEVQLVEAAAMEMKKLPIFIEDSGGISVGELRAKARRLKLERNIQVIFVDYIQLISGGKRDTREQEVSYVSRTLKATAKELGVPVVALSQLSRLVEQRTDRTPILSDLRDSGALEQDADCVIFVSNLHPLIGATRTITVAKHRNGPTDEFSLGFEAERAEFLDTRI